MQMAICKEKTVELGDSDRIWGPMVALADGFLEEARKDWEDHLKIVRMPRDAFLSSIVEATAQASREAGFPYREQCDPVWTQRVIEKFLATFDPAELLQPLGQA
jgi:hypothetical protein